jgi:Flp pilus assembly pilin Flp
VDRFAIQEREYSLLRGLIAAALVAASMLAR